MLCTIWNDLYNLKKVRNTHGGVLLLGKLHFVYNPEKENF